MGLFSKLFGGGDPATPESGLGIDELARRLGMAEPLLRHFPVNYTLLRIPKNSGGTRDLQAPRQDLKELQRLILRRLFTRLAAHPAATGFERGQSIATNARPHAGATVLVKMDLRDFFTQTTATRVRAYFIKIGWNGQAADLLVRLTTYKSGLPQGAPTSPRLSNLVNYGLDARLFAAGLKLEATYTRYADDMTFSFKEPRALPEPNPQTPDIRPRAESAADERHKVAAVIRLTKHIVDEYGYKLHQNKKLQIRRRHDRMLVTGVVVNQTLNLPRETRRRLRAVRHHLQSGKPATLSPAQIQGWAALESMIAARRPPG